MKINGLSFRNPIIARKTPISKNTANVNPINLKTTHSCLDALAGYNSPRFMSDWDDDLFNTGHDYVVNIENYYDHEVDYESSLSEEDRIAYTMEKKYKEAVKLSRSFILRMKILRKWANHRARKYFPSDYNSGKMVDVTQVIHSQAKLPITDVFVDLNGFYVKRENEDKTFDVYIADKKELKKVFYSKVSLQNGDYDATDEFNLNDGKLREYSSGVKVRDGIKKIDEHIVLAYNPSWMGECYKNLVIMPDGTKYYDNHMKVDNGLLRIVTLNESNPCPEEILEKFKPKGGQK